MAEWPAVPEHIRAIQVTVCRGFGNVGARRPDAKSAWRPVTGALGLLLWERARPGITWLFPQSWLPSTCGSFKFKSKSLRI